MISVNMHEAKTRLSQLVEAAEQGENILICRDGTPVAELRPLAKPPVSRLTSDPKLRVKFSLRYDPTETAGEDEWPEDSR